MSTLPVFNAEPPERADAARNRRVVLEAAERLFERDPDGVTMEAVAAEAGVGKGTVFRRFGDRAGLARAVIGRYEAEMQEEIIRGAPPLGPGAPARERLIAFGARYLQFLERHGRLLVHASGVDCQVPGSTWFSRRIAASSPFSTSPGCCPADFASSENRRPQIDGSVVESPKVKRFHRR